MAKTIVFLRGIPEAVIPKLTGHRSRELERFEHLSPLIEQQTVELIASELKSAADTATDAGDTATAHPPSKGLEQNVEVIEKFGGDDGARTRDLRRDRPAF